MGEKTRSQTIKDNENMSMLLGLLFAISMQLVNCKDANMDYGEWNYLESSCVDYDWECAAVNGVEFGMTALKIILSLIVISCIVTWICMLGCVVWLFVRKRN